MSDDDLIERRGRLARLAVMVKRRRQALGMSQPELAEHLHTDRSQISRLENGKIDPTASDLLILADALQTTVTELLEEDQDVIREQAAELVRDPMLATYFAQLGGATRRATPRERTRIERLLRAIAEDANEPETPDNGQT